MNHISITNPDLTKQENTTLASNATAGSSVILTVENNQGFSVDDLIIIPKEGEEKSEKCQITAITDSDKITVGTLKFDHLKGVKIRKTPYDQVVLSFSATEEGTYVAIGTWSDINFDDLVTYIDHAAGTSSTWYKAEFKNSVSGQESGVSDAFQVTADVHYCTLNQILEEAGMLGNRYIAPEKVLRMRANAESEVKGSLGSRYSLPLSEVPEVVRDATKLLVAGRLLWQEFGSDAAGTINDGGVKIKEGRSLLKNIREGSIILLDSDDVELTRTGVRGISGWPNESTKDATDENAGGKINFRMNKKF